MNYRLSTLLAEKTFIANATEVIDINVADPISQLLIELEVNGSADAAVAHAIACLTKIELVDGSDVLFSLSGYEAEAADILQNGLIRSNFNCYLNTLGVQRYIGINFGRKLWDPLLAFDPKKFKNPQLKLSLDINAGGNSSAENKLTVLAAMFDEKMISPIGFLMHKEIKDYAMAASAHNYTDLPTDFPYRKLFIRQMTVGTEPCQHVDTIKLSQDVDKKVVFDHEILQLLRSIAAKYPQLEEQIIFAVTTGTTYVYTTVSERATATFAPWATAAATTSIASYGSAGGRMAVIASAAMNAVAHVSGWAPHGVWEIPFGDQDDIDDWFDVEGIGSLRLDVKGTSGALASDSVQIFLQQLRRY